MMSLEQRDSVPWGKSSSIHGFSENIKYNLNYFMLPGKQRVKTGKNVHHNLAYIKSKETYYQEIRSQCSKP